MSTVDVFDQDGNHVGSAPTIERATTLVLRRLAAMAGGKLTERSTRPAQKSVNGKRLDPDNPTRATLRWDEGGTRRFAAFALERDGKRLFVIKYHWHGKP